MSITTPLFTSSGDPVVVAGIELVRWPDDERRRRELADERVPALLLVDPGAAPPRCGPLEDWIREPVEPSELRARLATLRDRLMCASRPELDDGLLLHNGAWAAVPVAQVAMVQLLVDRFGAVVRKEELAEAARACGGTGTPEAVKTAMVRLARRVGPLGLELRAIRRRGYLLHSTGRCPLHGGGAADTKG